MIRCPEEADLELCVSSAQSCRTQNSLTLLGVVPPIRTGCISRQRPESLTLDVA